MAWRTKGRLTGSTYRLYPANPGGLHRTRLIADPFSKGPLMNNTIDPAIHQAIQQSIKAGATDYRVGPGRLTLHYPDGEEALRLPMLSADPARNKAQARLVLQELAWNDYQQLAGKVVLVTTLYGNDNGRSYEMRFDAPLRVRVSPSTHPDDIERWTDSEYLDPAWDVTLIDTHVPEAAALTWPWIYGTSRSLSGAIEPGDMIREESFKERIQRFASDLGLMRPRAPELLIRL